MVPTVIIGEIIGRRCKLSRVMGHDVAKRRRPNNQILRELTRRDRRHKKGSLKRTKRPCSIEYHHVFRPNGACLSSADPGVESPWVGLAGA